MSRETVQTRSTATPVTATLATLESTVRLNLMNVSHTLVSMETVLIASTTTPVTATLATLESTVKLI